MLIAKRLSHPLSQNMPQNMKNLFHNFMKAAYLCFTYVFRYVIYSYTIARTSMCSVHFNLLWGS